MMMKNSLIIICSYTNSLNQPDRPNLIDEFLNEKSRHVIILLSEYVRAVPPRGRVDAEDEEGQGDL